MGRDSDPIAQRIHRENVERMCLASFVGGLQGTVGRHTRIANPQSIQQALTIALAATEALRQEMAARYFWQKHRRNVRYTTRAQTRGETGFQRIRK